MDTIRSTDSRKGDSNSGQPPKRNERLFKQGDYWYFRTREGMDIGPFDVKADAEQGVASFIEFLGKAEPEVIHRIHEYVTAA